jgi:hypothetical protein
MEVQWNLFSRSFLLTFLMIFWLISSIFWCDIIYSSWKLGKIQAKQKKISQLFRWEEVLKILNEEKFVEMIKIAVFHCFNSFHFERIDNTLTVFAMLWGLTCYFFCKKKLKKITNLTIFNQNSKSPLKITNLKHFSWFLSCVTSLLSYSSDLQKWSEKYNNIINEKRYQHQQEISIPFFIFLFFFFSLSLSSCCDNKNYKLKPKDIKKNSC